MFAKLKERFRRHGRKALLLWLGWMALKWTGAVLLGRWLLADGG